MSQNAFGSNETNGVREFVIHTGGFLLRCGPNLELIQKRPIGNPARAVVSSVNPEGATPCRILEKAVWPIRKIGVSAWLNRVRVLSLSAKPDAEFCGRGLEACLSAYLWPHISPQERFVLRPVLAADVKVWGINFFDN
jgi:hypothetical protein